MSLFDDFLMMDTGEDEGNIFSLLSLDDDQDDEQKNANRDIPEVLPSLALKNTVLFPFVDIPITVGRPKSIAAIRKAYNDNRLIGVISQRSVDIEDPTPDDLFEIGTVGYIRRMLRMPDGSVTAILRGWNRFKRVEILQEEPFLEATIEVLESEPPSDDLEFEATITSIRETAYQIIELSAHIPTNVIVMLRNITNDVAFMNFIASNIGINLEAKQVLLEVDNIQEKAELLLGHIENERRLLEVKDQIESKVRGDIEKQQREYFLNQQMKTIQEELGTNSHENEIKEIQERGAKKEWPKEAKRAFDKEIARIKRVNPQAPEYSIILNYLDMMLDLPWGTYTEDNFDLKKVREIFDKDHYGLEKVKDRIIEHLAVLKLKGDMKAPILCLVGPPGVGKTSLGKSIARALGRKFVRMSLGGLHDESEIRGHRKTYIGAMPGRIMQSLKKAESSNPVFVLDEIDKIGASFRGDPSSALLEVLDPEQNETFYDNYLELEYDLSKVLFVATANYFGNIQSALRDRMETIFISGYSLEEKVEIALRHLIPKQRKEHGLKATHVKLNKTVLTRIIRDYTRESGVRELNRKIASVMRSIAKKVAMEEQYDVRVKPEELYDLLGPIEYTAEVYENDKMPGIAVGLAWTSVGGEILFVEALLSPGKGGMTLTGNLGEVMKESASTARSFLKANAESLGIDTKVLEESDLHIHVPEGAVPKDGPSAGITMLTAMASAYRKKPIRSHLAMTGEITLRGRVLPVGGIKEKILAAKRAGIKDIILCKENERHVKEVNKDFIKGLRFHYVSFMKEVLEIAFNKKK